jgi:hypothetical protein
MWCFLQISKSPRLYDWQSFQPYRGSKGTLHADWSYPPKKVAYQDGGGGGDRVRDARFDSVLRQLEAVTAFAPLHTPSALSVIRFAQEHFPGLPQVACFDTTFHAELAEVARGRSAGTTSISWSFTLPLQLREVAPHGEPAGPHIPGVRRGQLGTRRIRQAVLALVNTGRFSPGRVSMESDRAPRCWFSQVPRFRLGGPKSSGLTAEPVSRCAISIGVSFF